MAADAWNGEQRKVLNRLKRARGQLDAVIAAAEAGAPCKQVVTQLAAVSSALDRAGFVIISSAMSQCLAEAEASDAEAAESADNEHLTIRELEQLFLMLA